MCSFRPIQGCVDVAPRMTKGVAALFTLAAIAIAAFGATYLITNQSPLKFFNRKWAIGSLAGGTAVATLGIAILLHQSKRKVKQENSEAVIIAPPNTPEREPRKEIFRSFLPFPSLTTAVEEPPQEEESPWNERLIGSSVIRFPKALHNDSEDLSNTFYWIEDSLVINAHIEVDGEPRDISFMTTPNNRALIEQLKNSPELVLPSCEFRETVKEMTLRDGSYYRDGDDVTMRLQILRDKQPESHQFTFRLPRGYELNEEQVLYELQVHLGKVEPINLLRQHLEKSIFYHTASGRITNEERTLYMTPLQFTASDEEILQPGQYRRADGVVTVCVAISIYMTDEEPPVYTFEYADLGHEPTVEDIMRELTEKIRTS